MYHCTRGYQSPYSRSTTSYGIEFGVKNAQGKVQSRITADVLNRGLQVVAKYPLDTEAVYNDPLVLLKKQQDELPNSFPFSHSN